MKIYAEKTFKLIEIGENCDVWVAAKDNKAEIPSTYIGTDATDREIQIAFSEIANTFDKAFKTETKIFGGKEFNQTSMAIKCHIAQSSKIHIIIYEIHGSTVGFTDSFDFFCN